MSNNYDRFAQDFEASLTPEERRVADAFEDHYSFAQEVAALRRSLNLTQAEVSARSGIPRAEISRIEHGEVGVTIPRAKRLLRSMGGDITITQPAYAFGEATSARPAAAPAAARSRGAVEA